MRHAQDTGTMSEKKALGAVALVCYSTTLASLLVFGYALLTLALSAAARQVVVMYPPHGF